MSLKAAGVAGVLGATIGYFLCDGSAQPHTQAPQPAYVPPLDMPPPQGMPMTPKQDDMSSSPPLAPPPAPSVPTEPAPERSPLMIGTGTRQRATWTDLRQTLK